MDRSRDGLDTETSRSRANPWEDHFRSAVATVDKRLELIAERSTFGIHKKPRPTRWEPLRSGTFGYELPRWKPVEDDYGPTAPELIV